MGRRKRASMREGPLADLFRSTIDDDPPADPPEAPKPGEKRADEHQGGPDQPRFGREEPVPSDQPRSETPQPPAPSPDPAPSP